MLDKYLDYNKAVREMIIHYDDDCEALESLMEQYAELLEQDGLGAINYNKISTTTNKTNNNINDITINRIETKQRMEELQRNKRIFDKAWNKLTNEEKTILEMFYKSNMLKDDIIVALMEILRCERASVYRKKDAAFDRFKRLLFG